MSEVNGTGFGVNNVNFNSVSRQNSKQEEREKEQREQINDFSDPKAEALGRSMLVKESDNTNNDLKALLDNPQIAENSDKIFEAAYAAALQAGLENPYEEAASASTVSM